MEIKGQGNNMTPLSAVKMVEKDLAYGYVEMHFYGCPMQVYKLW